MNPLPPELDAFLSQWAGGVVFGQVWIESADKGFRIRHECDRRRDDSELREITLGDLRSLAQTNALGQFRPLRSSPDLQSGWKHQALNRDALYEAIQRIYPGALADWYAAASASPPVTSFADFASRQTGIYKAIATLSPRWIAEITLAGCHSSVCIKRRLWPAADLPCDTASQKSLIPCLEPCALLLEMSRRSLKCDREVLQALPMGAEEVATVRAALERALRDSKGEGRQADFNDPMNPRRILVAINRLPTAPGATPSVS